MMGILVAAPMPAVDLAEGGEVVAAADGEHGGIKGFGGGE